LRIAVSDVTYIQEVLDMASDAARRKNILIDQAKLRKAQTALNAKTETETIDKALDQVLFGQEVVAALLEVAGRGKAVEDVFGNLRQRSL
jgi:hypothetical protein